MGLKLSSRQKSILKGGLKSYKGEGRKDGKIIDSSVLIFDMMNLFKIHFSANRAITEDGIPMGGCVGSLNAIYFLSKKFRSKRVLCVFDGSNAHEKRKNIDEAYKANRNESVSVRSPFELGPEEKEKNKEYQMHVLIKCLKQLPVVIMIRKNLEADDIIGHLTKSYYSNKGGQRVIISTDKDFLQLIDHNTSIYSPRKRMLYSSSNMGDDWDLATPKNIVFQRCIQGDPSDNLIGVKGVGKKTISKLLPELSTTEISSIDEFIDLIKSKKEELSSTKTGEKLLNGIDDIRRNYKICQLQDPDISNGDTLYINETLETNEYNPRNKNNIQKFILNQGLQTAVNIKRLRDLFNILS